MREPKLRRSNAFPISHSWEAVVLRFKPPQSGSKVPALTTRPACLPEGEGLETQGNSKFAPTVMPPHRHPSLTSHSRDGHHGTTIPLGPLDGQGPQPTCSDNRPRHGPCFQTCHHLWAFARVPAPKNGFYPDCTKLFRKGLGMQ